MLTKGKWALAFVATDRGLPPERGEDGEADQGRRNRQGSVDLHIMQAQAGGPRWQRRDDCGCRHLRLATANDSPEGRGAILDLDLVKMERLAHQQDRRYRTLRRFPVSAFDLSVVAGLLEPSGDIERQLSAAAASDLVDIEFVRVYTGAPLPEDRKSVSYRLTVAAPDRTLSSDEVAAIRTRVIDAMRANGYELRV